MVPEYEDLLEAAHSFAGAKLLADAGRLPEALAAYEHVLELDGSDPYAYLEAARFHSYLAKAARADRKQRLHLEKATEYSTRARQLEPTSDDVLFQFAQIHLRLVEQNHFPSLVIATGAFEELWQRGNEGLNVLLSLGQLYLWQRQGEKAVEVLQAATNRQPNHRMAQFMLVEALVGGEDRERIKEALVRLLELDPAALEYRLRLAALLSEKRFHSRVVELLREAPPEDQLHPQLRQTLAQELHLSGDNKEALVLADALLVEFTPVSEGLRRLRISILSSLAKYEEAIEALVALLPGESNPSEVARHTVLLSRLLERVGRTGEAAQHLRDLIAQREGREQLQLKLGLLALLERQDVGEEAVALARTEFEEALSRGENVMAFGRLLSNLLARMSRFEEADAVVEQIRGTLPEGAAEENSQLDLQHMAFLVEAEAWNDVVTLALKVEASPKGEIREAGRILKAEALARLDRVEEALESLAGEGSDGLLIKRLQILSENGDQATVRRELEKRAQSGSSEDLFFAAQTYQSLGLHREAIPLLERVLTEGVESVNVFFSLGAAQERAGAHDQAEVSFRRLLEVAPDHAPTLNYLGYMWADRGENLKEALHMLHRAVALEPENGAYVDSLGWVYFRLGEFQEARLHMEWAVRLVPDDPTIFEHLGDIYVRLEEREQARKSYRQALDLGADEAEELRNKLRSLEGKGL
jgi:tetratricopeptide (TPR) repeat protein